MQHLSAGMQPLFQSVRWCMVLMKCTSIQLFNKYLMIYKKKTLGLLVVSNLCQAFLCKQRNSVVDGSKVII